MNTDLAVVLLLLASSIAMFAINKPRMDAVALLMLTVLPFTGVITVDEALAGFMLSRKPVIAAAKSQLAPSDIETRDFIGKSGEPRRNRTLAAAIREPFMRATSGNPPVVCCRSASSRDPFVDR